MTATDTIRDNNTNGHGKGGAPPNMVLTTQSTLFRRWHQSKKIVDFDTGCAVFAETEAIYRVADGAALIAYDAVKTLFID